jgi:8-oxo-dGTP pyrophosphatase MutT (NUDIX family)
MNVSFAMAHQIAALPWRETPGGIEVALVSTRDTRRWVIPKGWPMPGLSDPEAAAREAFEEAGLVGDISSETVGQFNYDKRKKNDVLVPVRVTVYPMQVTQELEIWPEQHQRVRAWFRADAAASLVQEDGMRDLLNAFKPL